MHERELSDNYKFTLPSRVNDDEAERILDHQFRVKNRTITFISENGKISFDLRTLTQGNSRNVQNMRDVMQVWMTHPKTKKIIIFDNH